jgi:hypothetical protein
MRHSVLEGVSTQKTPIHDLGAAKTSHLSAISFTLFEEKS